MKSWPISLAAASLLAVAPSLAKGQGSPSPKELLELQPILKGVEYESPADDAAVASCKTETVFDANKKPIGVALRDSQGKLLRRFVDADGNNKMDTWSYFQDGFEVYRETDQNADRSPDECRWLNSAGTRIAEVNRGKVTLWRRLSAEEAAKVFVQALVTGELSLLESVMATGPDLEALGMPKALAERVDAAAGQRPDQVRNLQKTLIGWNSKTVWNRLDGQMPHLIPSDNVAGLSKDLILYENAVIFAGPPGGQPQPSKIAFLQASEMVKIGDVWKFIELPRAIDPEKPILASEGGVRSWLYRQQAGPAGDNPAMDEALRKLADFDNANAKAQVEGGKKELAQFHVGRVPLLRAVVKATTSPDERLNYEKQVVDSLAAAYQTGLYASGMDLLETLAKGEGKLGSYSAFRKVSAEFAARNDEPGVNLMASQKQWMDGLKAFLKSYPNSDEAPDALMQLASASEFNAEEDEARTYYAELTAKHAESDAGKKAAGALKRLDLVGKSMDLSGPGLDRPKVEVGDYRGKTLLITFWASWAEPVRRDLPELLKVYQKFRGQGFEVLGVNLDNDRDEVDAFLKQNPLPWAQIFEPGGIERNRYASEFGIIALPTMVLVDGQGKVLSRNIRSAAELERLLDKTLAAKQPGVALDR